MQTFMRDIRNSHLSDLDGSSGLHLLAQVVLVLRDGSVPAADGLVLADHDVLGNLVKESVTWLATV